MYRLLILTFTLSASICHADAIFKSVDDEGNVIYSEQPPADSKNVKTVEPPAEATDDEAEAARERQKKLQTYLDESAESGGQTATTVRAQREAAKRRAVWGKDWPIHEPLRK